MASSVAVQGTQVSGTFGTGFGWAPDPRSQFCYTGAYFVTYTDCQAANCDVAFDTWNHVGSTWTRPVYTNCPTGFLVQPGATRTLTANACSECDPPISVTLTNFAGLNTYPGSS